MLHVEINVTKQSYLASHNLSDSEILVRLFQFPSAGNDFQYLVFVFETFVNGEIINGSLRRQPGPLSCFRELQYLYT